MGEMGVKWLTILFNKILNGSPMPKQWRESYLLPLFKGKGDTRMCDNYRSVKFTSHTLKINERAHGTRLRKIINVSSKQCGFASGRSTTDAIQTVRILMETHREALTDLHIVLVDFEKAFDRLIRELIWVALRDQLVPETYVRVIQDMYTDSTTRIKCAFV